MFPDLPEDWQKGWRTGLGTTLPCTIDSLFELLTRFIQCCVQERVSELEGREHMEKVEKKRLLEKFAAERGKERAGLELAALHNAPRPFP